MARGIFSLEAMASLLLIVLAVSVLLFAFKLQAESVEAQLSLLESEGLAMRIATHLLGACPKDGGLAECGNGEAVLGIIGKQGIGEFSLWEARERFKVKSETGLRVEVNRIRGGNYLKEGRQVQGTENSSWVLCVKRLALLGGKEMEEVLLVVCFFG